MMGVTMKGSTAARLVRPDEFAAELGIPVKTLAEWRSRGLGPAYIKVGRHVRYRREAIAEWEAGQTRRPTKTALG
jgi:predicted DNA-binding transcriptional regulator AlpA